jgi:microcystin-dependent protein
VARGQEFVCLLEKNLPSHNHGTTEVATAVLEATTEKGSHAVPTENSRFAAGWSSVYQLALENYLTEGATEDVPLGGVQATVDVGVNPSGDSLDHHNIQPCLATNYIIAVKGVFPPRPS